MIPALLPFLLLLFLVPAEPQSVVFVIAGEDDGHERALRFLAEGIERTLEIETHVLIANEGGRSGANLLEGADLLVLSNDRRLEVGPPSIARRPSGGQLRSVMEEAGVLTVASAASGAGHPILNGLQASFEVGAGALSIVRPLPRNARPLLFGRIGAGPAEPVAWVFDGQEGSSRFVTTLGTPDRLGSASVRTLLVNAIAHGLGREPPAGLPAPPDDARSPPVLTAPEDATILFAGSDIGAWRAWHPAADPPAVPLEPGQPVPLADDAPDWTTDGRALVVRPGGSDLISRELFGDFHLHLDFRIPREPAGVADAFRGNSGVYLAGRHEIQLLDTFEKDLTDASCGAITGQRAPSRNASRPAGVWQSLDIVQSHQVGELPRVSVWLNDVLVQDDVEVAGHTPGGFLAPLPGTGRAGGDDAALFVGDADESLACDFGSPDFAVSVRFRGQGDGTLIAKCNPAGKWTPNAKALFLRGGRLVYDIGWVGALTSKRRVDDGEWHHAVLTSNDGVARLIVDGELEGERGEFAVGDEESFVVKLGAANQDFGGTYSGDLGEVRFFASELGPAVARDLSLGHTPEIEPEFRWAVAPPAAGAVREDGVLLGPIRLQADCSEVRFANIWVRPLDPVDHAGLIAGLDRAAYERGEKTYNGLCVACHGSDGTRPTYAKARPFALGTLKNGTDPFSLFRTVTDGYGEMPGNAWLEPAQRYDVIHYIREQFLKERNPGQYFEVSDAWLNSLPKGRSRGPVTQEAELPRRDHGPVLASQLGDDVGCALTVRLDEDTSISYDLQILSSPAAWSGGFLDLAKTQHHQQRGEGRARPGGPLIPGLDGYGWGYGDKLDWDRSRRPPRGPLPTDWLDYHGHYVHGDSAVLAYAVEGREVLEWPTVDARPGFPVFSHRLRVGPGEKRLRLGLVRAPGETGEPGEMRYSVEGPAGTQDEEFDSVLLARTAQGPFAATAVWGGATLEVDGRGRASLVVEPSDRPREIWVLRCGGEGVELRRGFTLYLANLKEHPLPASPGTLVRGGPARWDREFTFRGTLGPEDGAYAVDTVPLPDDNPWNAWVRTSALDFFADGRAAVSTYGGDIWIVSGLDGDLERVTWRRFAAGMFEPMGVRVVDDQVYVTCRDRITRLHDLNDNGEADFYESFFADPDVSPNFHAFNFDLQTDAAGNFYYAKSGQYTDFALPGAILKVAPDGSSYQPYCTGLRTPNGMGMSPDGRPLVSDNQGNWVPASKISLTREGGFYGVFKSINTSSPGVADRDDFDPPVLWMPQEFDSSSGGQLFVGDERFGPLAGRYLHTSFGKGWLYSLSIDRHEGVEQGAAWKLPFQFAAGTQRLRVHPVDGQVWTVGLSGWQGPAGGADGCLQRLRHTGRDETLLLSARIRDGQIVLEFSQPLDRASAEDPAHFQARRWNYRWTRNYGSAHYSVSRPGEEGEDEVGVVRSVLQEDSRTVQLELEDLTPAHQWKLAISLQDRQGAPVELELFLTVHAVHR